MHSEGVLKRLPLAAIATLLVVLLDQLSKWWVVNNLDLYESMYPIPALAHIFRITHLTNTGAAFGLLQEAGGFFTIAVIVITIIILIYLRRVPRDRWLTRVALGIVVGGALGNLIDRLSLGYVIDFIDFSFFAKFNVADSAVSIGVVLLFIATWLDERAKPATQNESLEVDRGMFSTDDAEARR
jgi:signal peptidase II